MSYGQRTCGRCENTYDCAPWMIYDGYTLVAYCPDCAIAEMEDRLKRREADQKRLRSN